jgi:hypothetical protein
MTFIDDINNGEHVDGVKFYVAAIFEYIIEKFDISEKSEELDGDYYYNHSWCQTRRKVMPHHYCIQDCLC